MPRPATTTTLLLLSLVLLTGPLHAQAAAPDTSRYGLARDLLHASGTAEAILASIQASIPEQQKASPELPDEFWNTFASMATNRMDEFVERLVPAYASAFSADDLRTFIAFYQSPAGTRMVEASQELTGATMRQAELWGMSLAADVIKQLADDGVLLD